MSESTTKVNYRPAIERYVKEKFDVHLRYNGYEVNLDADEYNHIIGIGISIVETKFPEIGPGYSGGSFVQAVADNDLMGAVGRADSINIKFLKFYCTLLYNFSPYHLK